MDWTNPKTKISKYFTVHEATYLPSWKIYHTPSEAEKTEIVKLAQVMDIIRERIGGLDSKSEIRGKKRVDILLNKLKRLAARNARENKGINMTYAEVIKYYDSEIKAAVAIGVSQATVNTWKRAPIPRLTQLAIQTLTKGKLKAGE